MALTLPKRFTPPLLLQVFGLLVLILVAAQAVNIGILYLLPPPPPEFFRTTEVAQALKAAGTPVPTGAGHPLQATLAATPRNPVNPRAHRLGQRLRDDIATQLGVKPEQVRLTLMDSQRLPFPRNNAEPPGRPDRGGPPDRGPAGEDHGRASGPGPGLMAGAGPGVVPAFDGRRGEGGRSGLPHNDRYTGERFGGEHYVISPFVASLQLPDGRWANVVAQDNGLFSTWLRRVLLWFGVCVLALGPVAYFFARSLASPIGAFARAAERLGRDPGAPPLALRGPAEVATAVGAFNEMQDRLRRYVTDRTATVGAIAHDLRTPLTRLRFRVETLPDGLGAKMSSDIDEMEQMISATLAFVRDGARIAPYGRLELASLVGTVADEMADTGKDVQASSAGGPVVVDGDGLALRRLTANLLDNAVKFGGGARVRVYTDEDTAVIEVDDDGPGVSEADMVKVFEPFQRGEPSRSRETGGAGLGLAVVRSIARAHGGDASIENRAGGGLRARARLPLAPMHA